MSSAKFIITEPQPTVEAGHYTHSGRGGAGNTFKMTSTSSSRSSLKPVASASTSKYSSKKFYSGIGGAGNAHGAEERATMSFDEDFDRARVREAQTAGHVGVGGAGNVYRRPGATSSSGGSRRSSHESTSSGAGFWGRLSSSSFNRH
jgi:hypothetical protein